MIWAIGIPCAYVIGIVLMARFLWADFIRETIGMTEDERKRKMERDGAKAMIGCFSILWPIALIMIGILFTCEKIGPPLKRVLSRSNIRSIITGPGDKIIAYHESAQKITPEVKEGDRDRGERDEASSSGE